MASAEGFDPAAALADVDGPRPVPAAVTERVAAALEAAAGGLPVGLDRPRAVPAAVADRVTGALLTRPVATARLRRLRLGAAAAVIVALLGTVAAATRPTGDGVDGAVTAAPPSPSVGRGPRPAPTTTSTSAPVDTTTTTEPTDGVVVALDDSNPVLARLATFGGCGELLDWARSRAAEEVTEYGLAQAYGTVVPADGASGLAQAESGGQSGTNVQEAGVDEPDIVETDGRALYVTDGTRVHAVTATGDPEVVSTTTLADDQRQAHSLVLDGDRLAVLVSRWSDAPSTEVHVLGVADPANPTDAGGVSLTGSYVQARATEHVLHVVTTSAPGPFPFTYPNDGSEAERQRAEAENRRVVESSTLEQWLPAGVACDSVRHPRDLAGFTTTTVWSVPFADPRATTSTAILADAQTVYATADRLVVGTQRWEDAVPAEGDATAVPPGTVRTQLHRFALAPSGATYLASGQVPGYLHSSYALSERGGYLRVATTDQPPWLGTETRASSSAVTVLAQQGDVLVPVGAVGGLGQGEQIQGVRFVDDVAFVVTFRQVDPLYVIDLRDPTAPRLRGELHVTGFSAYLHPLGGGRLLGVGIEADEEGRRRGGAVSLYDVSDLDRPTLTHRVESPETDYLATFDPHAFLFWEPTGMVVLPAMASGGGAADVFRTDGDELTREGRITHEAHGGGTIERGVYVDGVLFTVGSHGVLASDAETLGELGWASFEFTPSNRTGLPVPAS